LVELVRKSKRSNVLLAALPGLGKEQDELVFRRMTELLAAMPTDNGEPYSDACYLLIALGDRFPDKAEGVFRSFLKPGTVACRRTVICALKDTCGPLAIKLLAPLLDDKRDTGDTYPAMTISFIYESRLSIRVCDEAADAIAMNSKTLKFKMTGSHQNLDRQIDIMRREIAKMIESR
jgi:hypothetical protein